MNETSAKQTDFLAPKPHPWKPWVVATLAAILILGVAVGLMDRLGLFNAPQDATGAKALAAALAMVGAVLSAVVTLVGTIIKYSLDDRNYALAVQAEHRNRTETAIRAVDLLSENNEDATKSQMGGALLALVSLGELDLAVSLLAQLWPAGKVAPSVAEVILRAAFKSNSEETLIYASSVLFQNAAHIQQGEAHLWPISDKGWPKDLPYNCRLQLVCAASEWLISVSEEQPQTLRSPALILYQALGDDDPGIRGISAACLRPIVKALPRDSWRTLSSSGVPVSVAQIGELLAQHPDTNKYTDIAEKYERRLTELYKSIADETAPPASGRADQ